jgi:23S rRNA pseudouridine1911/1915/1917 synthase
MAASEREGARRTELVVGVDESGEVLLEFLSVHFINESKTRLRRLAGRGDVLVNGLPVPPRVRLQSADVVSLPPGLLLSPPPGPAFEVSVLYEDERLLCLDKPPGYPVLPARGGADAEFMTSLVAYLNRGRTGAGPYVRPHVVHRLDRDTSGVLLVTKDAASGRALGLQFQRRLVEKAYMALVEGVLPRSELRLDAALERMPGSDLRMRVAPRGGKPAATTMTVQERFGHFTLLSARPHTGRQHQIRVHLAAAGYPLAVDSLYGRRRVLTGKCLNRILGRRVCRAGQTLLARCPLHADSVRYAHPATGVPMSHSAPLPADMEGVLARLRELDPPEPSPLQSHGTRG